MRHVKGGVLKSTPSETSGRMVMKYQNLLVGTNKHMLIRAYDYGDTVRKRRMRMESEDSSVWVLKRVTNAHHPDIWF